MIIKDVDFVLPQNTLKIVILIFLINIGFTITICWYRQFILRYNKKKNLTETIDKKLSIHLRHKSSILLMITITLTILSAIILAVLGIYIAYTISKSS